ncbi:TRAP transporter permease [Halorubrum sp. DTA98]|uniref:TRAP transporter permease n=1 Tax=Halorubrum sp. DTA98 TaxID=3402163 RepID=UPI003AAFC8E2
MATLNTQRLPSVAEGKQHPVKYLVGVLAIAFGFVGALQPQLLLFGDNVFYTVWLWTFSLGIYWLHTFTDTEHAPTRYISIPFALASFGAGYYLISDFTALRQIRVGIYTDLDIAIGVLIIALTVLSAYKEYGAFLTGFVVVSLIYGFLGPFMPGIFQHAGLGQRVITANSVEFNGVFGIVTQSGARWVFVFLVYAGLIKAMGGLNLFLQIGFRAGKHMSSGVSQIAVLSSLIIGSISGSAPANTALTGSFTIPMMKERGIAGKTAAAIESVASSGGQIMPPVMGIVAFIMADLLGISYTDVIIMGAIPGFIFYGMVVFSVHLVSNKLTGDDDRELRVDEADIEGVEMMTTRQLLFNLMPIIGSLVLLVGVLVVFRINPARAAFQAIVTLVGLNYVGQIILANSTDDSLVAPLFNESLTVFEGVYEGMMAMAPITIIIAALNIIITMFNITGLGIAISLQILQLAEISPLLFLLVLSIVIILLGMGMPTIAAYLITVAVGVPALTEFGFAPAAAHFFVFYVAVFSNITPPVAFTCAVACNIAESDFISTCLEAMRIGIAMLIIPFIILYNPSLIFLTFPASLITIVVTTVALGLLIMVLQNWGIRGEISRATRGGYLLGSVALFGALIYVF